jgi:nucleotide-binding universal stress UspA family protein
LTGVNARRSGERRLDTLPAVVREAGKPDGKHGRRTMYHRILLALDDSACAQRALAQAVTLVGAFDATLIVVNVFDSGPLLSEPDAPEPADTPSGVAVALLERAQAIVAVAHVKSSVAALESGGESVPWVLLRAACEFEADLIVMGTHGRRGVRRLVLGSVAEAVLREARCPVLVVGQDGDCASAAGGAAFAPG